MVDTRKLSAALVRLACFVLSAVLIATVQGADEVPLRDNIAAACCANVVMGCIYLGYSIGRRILCVALRRGDRDDTRDDSATPLVCVAHERECATLEFQDALRGARASSQLLSDAPVPTLYITPSTLWYYVYTVGLAVFAFTYTLQCGTAAPSLVLGLGSTAAAGFFVVSDTPPPMRWKAQSVLRVGGLTAVFGLLVAAATLLDWTEARRNWWLGVLAPALAPACLGACRYKIRQVKMAADKVVLFTLPFVATVSVCYLSMYAPALFSYLDPASGATNINTNTSATASPPGGPTAGGVAAWLVYVLVMWVTLVGVTGATQRTEDMPGCSASFASVWLGKRLCVQAAGEGPLTTGLAVACMVATGLLLLDNSLSGDAMGSMSDYLHDKYAADAYARAVRLTEPVTAAADESREDAGSCQSVFSIGHYDEDGLDCDTGARAELA